jgi:phytol kinase
MMDNPLLALAIPSLLVVPAMGLLSRISAKSPFATEVRRKALHVAVGLAALSFPLFLTTPAMVLTAVAAVLAWMVAVRLVPVLRIRFGCVLHDARRKSYGDIYFALAIACLLMLPRPTPALYAVPLLILTVADAAAAIAGRRWPRGELHGRACGKTLTGCVVFGVTAFLVTAGLLTWFGPVTGPRVIAISFVTAALTSYTEAFSPRGFDNLTVPAVAWLVIFTTTAGV